jgi:surface protein
MKLNRNNCLGGRFNHNNITGIKINGHIIYPYLIDKNYLITYISNNPAIDPYIEGSIFNYVMEESINDEGLVVRQIGFENSLNEPIDINFKSNTNLLRVEKLKGGFKCTQLFQDCKYLTYADLSEIDTSKATNMSYMFCGCNRLEAVSDLSNFNTDSVTSMYNMFQSCYILKELKGLNKWNTSAVTDMSNLFNNCNKVKTLDLSSWRTSNVHYYNGMFESCYELETLDISNFDIKAPLYNMSRMFYHCNSLHTLKLDNCNNDTISKIINSTNFPTGYAYNKETGDHDIVRKIYCKEVNATGLTAPDGWDFIDCETNEVIN